MSQTSSVSNYLRLKKFSRSPRIQPDPPREEVRIPPPPPQGGTRATALLLTLLPGLMMAGVMGLIGVFMHTTNWLFFSLPMIGVGIIASSISHIYQTAQERKKIEELEANYQGILREKGVLLRELRQEFQRLLVDADPPVEECLDRVGSLSRFLWNRDPSDQDFLSVRVGIGDRPSPFSIQLMDSTESKNDPLLQQARKLSQEYCVTPSVPICISLRENGITGFAGQRGELLSLMRAVLIHLATHHSPDEVKLVIVFPEEETDEWEWTRWLPHVWDNQGKLRYLANSQTSAHLIFAHFEEILSQRQRVTESGQSRNVQHIPWYVFLLASPSMVEDEPFLAKLERDGPQNGMLTIYLGERVSLLPRNCRCMVRISHETPFIMYKGESYQEQFFQPDQANRKQADEFARRIAPVRPKQLQTREIPNLVTFLEMYGVRTIDELEVPKRWEEHVRMRKTLAVPIGVRAGHEPLLLDLHEKEHGPNGLVAGMVGGGKSELLQTLILSLAVNYHPHQVGFVIIDYKGGGMADPFVDLPHTMGIITNLQEGNLAQRALTSFEVELVRRQKLFAKYGVTHIDDYQRAYYRGEIPHPLPYLVIIVDEFAAMKAEQPEVASQFVKVAQLGRALGFRLILAMQKPAGIVDGQIEANTRFRLCLRVAQVEDSQAMLKRPDAAFLKGVGRALFQVGANEIFEEFQVAWCGAEYNPAQADINALEIAQVELNGQRRTLFKPRLESVERPVTQLRACIDYIEQLATQMGIERLSPLWMEPLPHVVKLDELRKDEQGWNGKEWLPGNRKLTPVVGKVDLIRDQAQPPYQIDLGRLGHAVVYGSPGYGKTTFLITLVTSLCLDHSPAEVQFYILDFGGKALLQLRDFPHVGAVITSEDTERISRFFDMILREMEQRSATFANAGAANLASYCELTGNKLPELVLIIDNFALFKQEFEDCAEHVVRIVREGASVGIHVVLTANDSSNIRFSLATNINIAIALHLIEKGEYASIVGNVEGNFPEAVPGRALVRGKPPLEVQVALPAVGNTEAERIQALQQLALQMRQSWKGPIPKPVKVLPTELPLSMLLQQWHSQGLSADDGIPIGLEAKNLEPFVINPTREPIVTIAGPPQCGKTTLLQTVIVAFTYSINSDRLKLYIIDSSKMELKRFTKLPHCHAYAPGQSTASQIMEMLEREVEYRSKLIMQQVIQEEFEPMDSNPLMSMPLLVLVVDDFLSEYSDSLPETEREKLLKLLRLGRRAKLTIFISSCSNDWKSYDPVCKELKRVGIMLGSSESTVFDLRLRHFEADKALPMGEGYWTSKGRSQYVKFASLVNDPVSIQQWMEIITKGSVIPA